MQPLESIFSTAHRQLRPRTPLPTIKVEFFPFAGLNHTVYLNGGRLTVRISDVLATAPPEVYEALAFILLAKLYRKKPDSSHHRTYRLFILSGDIQERARNARSQRSRTRPVRGPRGRYFDLDEIFSAVNKRYFEGSIDKPRLSWSGRRSRYLLGRYDATHDTIFISSLFDSPDIPRYVVQYVMFHELLHVKHQSQIHASRIVVHTPEFKSEERSFADYQEAKRWLRSI